MRRLVLSENKYGRLTIVGEPYGRRGKLVCDCICDCGNRRTVIGSYLIHGITKSCGCLHREILSRGLAATHGLTRKHPLYSVWMGMRWRCFRVNTKSFKDYGGRGITMCDSWRKDFVSFYDWALSNGYKPGLEIDRINNDGNYEASNCRFVTRTINSRNKRTTKLTMMRARHIRVLHHISGKTGHQIAALYGVCVSSVYAITNGKSWKESKEITHP